MSTFLELCQRLSRECGNPETRPTSVTNQTNEDYRFVRWIQEAYLELQGAWANWNFLWAEHSFTTVSGTRDYTASAPSGQETPSNLGEWDKQRFYIGTDPLTCYEYAEWDVETTASGKPWAVIIMPDNSLRLYPNPDAAYSITADYYKKPAEFSSGSSTGVVPEKFHDVIVWLALTKYAYFEAAQEVLEYARSELARRWPALEASQLPGQHTQHNSSTAELVIVPE